MYNFLISKEQAREFALDCFDIMIKEMEKQKKQQTKGKTAVLIPRGQLKRKGDSNHDE